MPVYRKRKLNEMKGKTKQSSYKAELFGGLEKPILDLAWALVNPSKEIIFIN